MGSDISHSSEDVCSDISLPFMVHCSLLVSLGIIMTLAFLEKRNRMWPECLGGRPGVVVPINLLDDYENRWSYACSFGAMINAIATLFFAPNAFGNVDTTYSKVFLSLIYATEVCVAYFPLFACLITAYRFIGSIMGGLYTLAWFAVLLFMTAECTASEKTKFPILALHIPTLIFLLVVVIKFVTMAIIAWRRKEFLLDPKPTDEVAVQFQMDFVKHAMNRHKYPDDDIEPTGWKEKLKSFVSTHIWEKMPHFKFSNRIVCTMFVATLITYELGLASFVVSTYGFEKLREAGDSLYNKTGWGTNVTEVVNLYTVLTEAGFIISSILASCIVTFDVAIILTKYRSNLIQLYRGDYSFLPQGYGLQFSSAEIMRFSMVFPGYQIAYKMWGLLIMVMFLYVLLLFGVFIIIFSVSFDAVTVLGTLFALIVIPIAVSLGLRFTQQALCYWFFLQNKVNEGDLKKPLALQNRRLYHITNFFFFIANIPIGLFSCLLRIGRSIMLGLIFLGRLDRCVLPPGFEANDKGFMSYVGMLLVEHTHNNPILRVFCQHLLWSKHNTTAFANIMYTSHENVQRNLTEMSDFARYHSSSGISRARQRWLLCYTLTRNPDLIGLRKHNLVDITNLNNEKSNKIMNIIKTGVKNVLGTNEQSQVSTISNPKMMSPDVKAIIASQHQEKLKASLDMNSLDHSMANSQSSDSIQRSATINDPNPTYGSGKY